MSSLGADVSPRDKLEPPAQFLCHITASSPPLNCDMQPFLFIGVWWLMSAGEATAGLRLSLGFPPQLHIIDGAADIWAGNWKYLAADESGDYYFCGLLRHLADADGFYYCVCSPVGNGGARAAMSFCCTGLIWEQERSKEAKINSFCELHFTSEGCIHQEEAATQGRGACFYITPLSCETGGRGELVPSGRSSLFRERPSFVCRCNLMSCGCS